MVQDNLTWQAAAAANLLEARKKHGRLGAKKSRSGCLTCKHRRVKCDEAQPQCSRCQSTGRACEYAQPKVKPTKVVSPVGSKLSQSMGLRDDDRRQLDFFLSRAAPRLAGSFDRDFWCGSILQLAQSEPIILDSLLAISTLYEHPQYLTSFRKRSEKSGSTFPFLDHESLSSVHFDHAPPVDTNHMNALKLYNRAIQGFNQRMRDDKATPLLALVTCVLFICIETIRDHVFAAVALFERGIGMLNQISDTHSSSEHDILAHIHQMFLRLGVLATTFNLPTPPLRRPETRPHLLSSSFQSIAEARVELFALMEESNTFMLATNEWRQALYKGRERRWHVGGEANEHSPHSVPDTPSSAHPYTIEDLPAKVDLRTLDQLSRQFEDDLQDPGGPLDIFQLAKSDQPSLTLNTENGSDVFEDLQKTQTEYLQKIAKWRKAFEPLCKIYESTDAGPMSYLSVLYYTLLIWMSARLTTRKTSYDDYIPEFRELVHYAEMYIAETNTGDRSIFTFDIGVVPSLYFAATECRVPSLRRRALALLKKAPKKESILGADSSAEVAYRLICIEERGLGLPDPADYNERTAAEIDDTLLPAQDKRWSTMEILKNRLTKAYEIRVTFHSEVNGYLERWFEDVPI